MLDCVSAMALRHAVWRSGASSYFSSGSDRDSRPKRYPHVLPEWFQNDGKGCRCRHCSVIRYEWNCGAWSIKGKKRKRNRTLRSFILDPGLHGFTDYGLTMSWSEIPRPVQTCVNRGHRTRLIECGIRGIPCVSVWCDRCKITWIGMGSDPIPPPEDTVLKLLQHEA